MVAEESLEAMNKHDKNWILFWHTTEDKEDSIGICHGDKMQLIDLQVDIASGIMGKQICLTADFSQVESHIWK